MSAPTRKNIGNNDTDDDAPDASRRYVPPWMREAANDAGDATLAPTEKSGRELPPVSHLNEPEVRRRRHQPVSLDDDIAARDPRAAPSLDPVAVPQPPR